MAKANVVTIMLHYVEGGIFAGEEGHIIIHVEGIVEIATVGFHGRWADYDVVFGICVSEHFKDSGSPVPPRGESPASLKVDNVGFAIRFGLPV